MQTTKDQIKDKGLLSKIHMPSRKCKLKQDTTKHLSEWSKSRTLTTQNAGKVTEEQEIICNFCNGQKPWTANQRDTQMTNQHVKRCLILLVMRKMQIKTTVRY